MHHVNGKDAIHQTYRDYCMLCSEQDTEYCAVYTVQPTIVNNSM